MDRQTEERIAYNDATFREANERVRAAADELGLGDGLLPFICECADPSCTDVVLLDRDAYTGIRADPRHFMNVPGHERVALGAIRVVETHRAYIVVEKTGHAGEVAEALDGQAIQQDPIG
jgi:hypothetical protein